MKKETSPAENLFVDFCQAYADRDMKAILSLMTQNVHMWGSGMDEYRFGLKEVEAQLKRDWSQSEKAEIYPESFVSAPNDANWAAAKCKVKLRINGQDLAFDHFRGTVIVEKEDGVWKISHTHASFPDYRNAEGGSFPVNS